MSVASSNASVVQVVPGGPVRGAVRPPGSKSLTNRALLCAALARGTSRLSGVLRSEDTEVMLQALQELGVAVERGESAADSPAASDAARTLTVTGIDGRPTKRAAELYIANSGTTIRFLTAALSALGGRYRLHGVPRMHERPIGQLTAAIEQLGGHAQPQSPGGCPPVWIDSQGWSGGEATVAGAVSSQFLSGLLMAAPLARSAVSLRLQGPLVSRPYVRMTARVMEAFGVAVDEPSGEHFHVAAPCPYQAADYAIEPDASAASYFWAAAAITGGRVTVEGLGRDALQGDVAFVDVLAQMGCQVEAAPEGITVAGRAARGIDVDMNAISDTVQTLAVVALFAEGPTTIRGVAHNRFKETDRIGDLARELRRLGAEVDDLPDGLRIVPGTPRGAILDTYDDHRMAMSLALAGLRVPEVRIRNPACTAKTYPDFFADLETLLGRPHRWSSAASDLSGN